MSRIDEIQAIGAIRSSHEKRCYKILYNNSKEDCDTCALLSEIDTLKAENTTLKARLKRADIAINDIIDGHDCVLVYDEDEKCDTCESIADYRSKT